MKKTILKEKLDFQGRIILPQKELKNIITVKNSSFYIIIDKKERKLLLIQTEADNCNISTLQDLPVCRTNEIGMLKLPKELLSFLNVKERDELKISIDKDTRIITLEK